MTLEAPHKHDYILLLQRVYYPGKPALATFLALPSRRL